MARAEALRPVLTELAGMSARAAAVELNKRKVATPSGGRWHAATVLRVRDRLQRTYWAKRSSSAETHSCGT